MQFILKYFNKKVTKTVFLPPSFHILKNCLPIKSHSALQIMILDEKSYSKWRKLSAMFPLFASFTTEMSLIDMRICLCQVPGTAWKPERTRISFSDSVEQEQFKSSDKWISQTCLLAPKLGTYAWNDSTSLLIDCLDVQIIQTVLVVTGV